ncbi:MAG: M14 family zinc carboxypeptidase [Blastocatellia bacterium]|nr:M14 family zinc carboxypeptidase [Blastocatellia bacterium]
MRTGRHLIIAILFCLILASIPAAQTAIDPPRVARVTIEKDAELDRFVRLGLDLLEMREGNDLFVLTTAGEIERLRGDGWRIRVDAERSLPFRTGALSAQTFRDGYRTLAEIRAQLGAAASRHPQLVETINYGQSWEMQSSQGLRGSDLFGVALTNRAVPGPKPTFFLMASIHARELATSEIAMRFVDHLLNGYGADGDATWLLDETRIVVIPVANPDGRLIAEQGFTQRKNTNTSHGGFCSNPPTGSSQAGVDLNRNFAFQFGLVNAPTEPFCSLTYPGPVAASEPETASLQTLIRAYFPDQRGPNDNDPAPRTTPGLMLTLHSYSDLVLWPWGTTRNKAPNSADLELIGRRFAAYNGYTPVQSIQLYPTSGTTDDWSYGELGVASFTFEIGPSLGPCAGFFAPYRCLDEEETGRFWPRNLPALLYAARIAAMPYALVQGPTPEELRATPAPDGRVEIRALFDETRNGGQPIASAELYLDAPPGRGGSPLQLDAADGQFDSATETGTITIPLPAPRTLFLVRARDAAGNYGPLRAAWLSRSTASGRGRLRR